MNKYQNNHNLNFIHLLRAFAALLIINSHVDKLFPNGLAFLATGGSFGNAIFLFTSGYTLSKGITSKDNLFIPWLYKRLVRIYPSVLIFMVISLFISKTHFSIIDWLYFNGSWFLQAILLYYIILFFVVKYSNKYLIYYLFTNYLLFVFYFLYSYNHSNWIIDIMDNPTRLHWVYYFMMMLLGAVVSQNNKYLNIIAEFAKSRGFNYFNVLIVALSTSIIIFYIPKYVVKKITFLYNIQLLYPILLLFFTYTVCLLSIEITQKIQRYKFENLTIGVIFMANLTLDIYVVHFAVIHAIRDTTIVFPINYLLAIILTIILAYFLFKCSSKIVNNLLN